MIRWHKLYEDTLTLLFPKLQMKLCLWVKTTHPDLMKLKHIFSHIRSQEMKESHRRFLSWKILYWTYPRWKICNCSLFFVSLKHSKNQWHLFFLFRVPIAMLILGGIFPVSTSSQVHSHGSKIKPPESHDSCGNFL